MARIRSVHPGLFTDECFITLSMTARLLMIGLWTEADDQGVFEWKPATLKVRIFPADNMDIEGALAALETSGVILAFQVGQKKYGAVRNFRKFQRPKSPKAVHPLPDDVRRYVGLCSDEPSPVTAEVIQFPQKGEIEPDEVSPFLQKGEISPQMEDGGGRREDEKKESRSADAPPDEPVPKNYAFSGQIIRVTADQFERWRIAYPAITDLRAALQAADDYYTENPPKNGKWFFAASKWLERDNKSALAARASRDRERGYAW